MSEEKLKFINPDEIPEIVNGRLKIKSSYKEKQILIRRKCSKEYRKKHIRIKFYKYIGVCFCPKCSNRGYIPWYKQKNLKTKYEFIYSRVLHMHREKRRMIIDGTCYVGVVNE